MIIAAELHRLADSQIMRPPVADVGIVDVADTIRCLFYDSRASLGELSIRYSFRRCFSGSVPSMNTILAMFAGK